PPLLRDLVGPVLRRLVGDAAVHLLRSQSSESAHFDKASVDILHLIFPVPFTLIPEELVDELEIVVFGQTARDRLRRAVRRVQREDAENVEDLARVYVVRLERGE